MYRLQFSRKQRQRIIAGVSHRKDSPGTLRMRAKSEYKELEEIKPLLHVKPLRDTASCLSGAPTGPHGVSYVGELHLEVIHRKRTAHWLVFTHWRVYCPTLPGASSCHLSPHSIKVTPRRSTPMSFSNAFLSSLEVAGKVGLQACGRLTTVVELSSHTQNPSTSKEASGSPGQGAGEDGRIS